MNSLQLPSFIRFGREICGDLEQAERREWWLANGRGAYASGTIAGTLTRRYHGLLVAPVRPPLGRMLVASKADATLLIDGSEIPLFSNRWAGGAIEPRGHESIESFHLDGRMPVWQFRAGTATVECRVWMEPGANTTYVAYRLSDTAKAAQLRIKLLVNARDHHGGMSPGGFDPQIIPTAQGLQVTVPDLLDLRLSARHGVIHPRRDWYENFDLPVERERGLPDSDSHLCVGEALLDLHPGEWSGVILSLHDEAAPESASHGANHYLEEAMRRFAAHDLAQLRRARAQMHEWADAPDWIDQLLLGADSFVFARPLVGAADGESVIAGYPWFGDWGRDTMIAMPGLTLATGRFDSARRILCTFARFVDQGMLPNVFPGSGEVPDYNTADAALWFIEAWRAYVAATDDVATLREQFEVLAGIIDWHVRGTRYGIGLDPADGLLRAGEASVQLTWMDAKVGDWVVTPRIGKPVEINALWFNALVAMAELARRVGLPADDYERRAAAAREGFQKFLDPHSGGLYDVIDGPDGVDGSVRPNQIFAVSLPASPLDAETQRKVVEICGRELFTSYGLRSLSHHHERYQGIYHGDVLQRDGSYHQGPVWAWLLAHFALAEYRVQGDAAAAMRRLEPLRDHLFDAGLGSISEILDGNAPHAPRGAPSQAWSVACTLEAWWRLKAAEQPEAPVTQPTIPASTLKPSQPLKGRVMAGA